MLSGLPSAADILLIADKLGAMLKFQATNLGLNLPTESGTLAKYGSAALDGILGDGSTTYGLSNVALKNDLKPDLEQMVWRLRYDSILKLWNIFTKLDNRVQTCLPSGWQFASSDGRRALDLWLTYLNANDPSTPAKPSATPSLTATTGGAIPSCVAGSAPRVKVCYQSSSGDWLVSQPSAASAQVALSGPNNAYTFTLAGNAPVTGYMLVFRQAAGSAAGDPYYYDQRVAITSGVAHPAVTCTHADGDLLTDLRPPSWLQCLLTPEGAALIALCYAGQPNNGNISGQLDYASNAAVSPYSVALNPANAFLGMDNPASTAEFGRWIGGTGYVLGAMAVANATASIVQGFAGAHSKAGAGGLQLRVASALDAGASITNVLYTYLDAANPVTPQNGTAAGPFALALGLGSTVAIRDADIPADRLVRTVTGMTVGVATTGTFVVEGAAVRTL